MKTLTAPKTRSGLANPYKVGDGATLCGYSDRNAYTVIKVTPQSITIQRDKATLLNGFKSGEPDALTFTPGGFSGHTEGVQRYSYERNPNGEICVARMTKRPMSIREKGDDGRYHDVLKPRFKNGSSTVVPGRHEHYDYNF
jgi:hypothetical protein